MANISKYISLRNESTIITVVIVFNNYFEGFFVMKDNEPLKRVRYGKSPLAEVFFQLRFPTILSINSTLPVAFQDQIREKFPYFESQVEEQNDIIYNPQMKTTALRKTGENKNYVFITENKFTKINLTPSFITISTRAYSQWEDFKKNIEYVIPLFEENYKPSFYTRVGLRYIDVITRSRLSLENKKWTELIKPHVLGMITEERENCVKSYVSETEYETKIENILSKSHFEFVRINGQTELSLLIDCDYYYLGVTKKDDMISVAENLHDASSMFIQTAITDDLHKAMEPVEI